jgi:2-keto-4-pentenoate hydratase
MKRYPVERKIVVVMIIVMIFMTCIFYGCQGNQSSSGNKETQIVNAILQAENTLTTIPSISKAFGDLSVEEAYKIQDLVTVEFIEKYGPVAGYKIGYADSSALKKNNLEVPAYGPIFKQRVLENGETVPLKDFRQFAIENEITFKIGKDIDKTFKSTEELKPYIESIHLGFDMSEDVFERPSTAKDFIACGAGSKYFMIGDGLSPDKVNLEDIMITVEFKNQIVYEGSSKNVLGNPWNVMLAVSNDLVRRGNPLKKGYLIFSGKAAPAYKVALEEAAGIFKGEGNPFKSISCNTR